MVLEFLLSGVYRLFWVAHSKRMALIENLVKLEAFFIEVFLALCLFSSCSLSVLLDGDDGFPRERDRIITPCFSIDPGQAVNKK